MTSRSMWATGGIVAAGAILAVLILVGVHPSGTGGKSDHGGDARAEEAEHEAAAAKGPHGGRLLSDGEFAVEVAIFEQGVPPEFRVYAIEKGRPVDPALVDLRLELERLGAPPETIGFRKTEGFLRGDREIKEPHSFKVTVIAQYMGRDYRWTYEQVEARVRIDDTAAKEGGITLKEAGPATIRRTIQLPGEIKFNRDRFAQVVPRLSGVIVESAKSLGDHLQKGDLLAVIESQALADLRSEHLAARSRLDLSRANFEREKRLRDRGISAEQEYFAARQALAEAEITHRSLEQKLLALGLTEAALAEGAAALTRYEIRAPIDGTVIEKHVAVGESVKDDATIFALADLSTVWAEMTVYSADLDKVKAGQKAVVRATAFDAEAAGSVSYIGSLVGDRTRSAKARVVLPNPERRWRPGLFVTVELVLDEAEAPVAVPVDAVQTYRDWKVVFARFGEYFEARPVQLGRTDGKWVEILSGLAPGTRYAAANSFIVKADLGKAGAAHDH